MEKGLVLFAITKSWQVSQSALRSLTLIAFQLKQEQDKIDNPKVNLPVVCPENDVCFFTCCIYSSALQRGSYHKTKHYEPSQGTV